MQRPLRHVREVPEAVVDQIQMTTLGAPAAALDG
jgi:hypothetical protein